MERVSGKIALVTGGASGIGRASALMLAREGARVAVSDINLDGAREVAEEIGDNAIAIAHDVTDETAWTMALNTVVAAFGGLHVLVNCAGSAKAGVRHLTKSVALHCARQGNHVRCNSVHPAFVDTPILDNILKRGTREEGLERLARQIPLGIVAEADDVAYAVVYLASAESRFMTGSELVLDGGISAM